MNSSKGVATLPQWKQVEREIEDIQHLDGYSETHKMLAEQKLRMQLPPVREGITLKAMAKHLGVARLTKSHLEMAGVKLRVAHILESGQPVYHHLLPEDVKAILIWFRSRQAEKAERAAAARGDLDSYRSAVQRRTKSLDFDPPEKKSKASRRKREPR